MVVLALQKKKFGINFCKTNTNFCLSLHYNHDNSYFLLMENKSTSLKPIITLLTFQLSCV